MSVSTSNYDTGNNEDPALKSSFGVPPFWWYSEPVAGPFALYLISTYAFRVCLLAFDDPLVPDHYRAGWLDLVDQEPTADNAATFCTTAIERAWGREPEDDELAACVDLALHLDEETTTKRKWAYVCSFVIASPNWSAF
jgi:hypothetical protein